MRQTFLLFIVIGFWITNVMNVVSQTTRALDTTTGIYYLKTGDGHEEYTVNGTVTFKLTKGTFPTYRDAGVTFAPTNPGELIQIKIESIDLDGSSNYLLLYQGRVETKYPMPSGWFEKIGVSAAGNVYASEATDGKLTIGFHSGSAGGQTGFTITVTSLSPKDMEFVSAGAFLDKTTANRGSRNQILGGATIKMDGGGNPHTLNELVFNTSQLSADQIENVRLYSSDKFTESSLLYTVETLGESVSYTSDFTLSNGENKFYLVADIKPDASGTVSPVLLTSVKINNEQKPIVQGTPENTLTIANNVLIDKQHLIYTVGEPVNFYDDGGKDGKITLNFNGAVTFVPSSPEKKIKIEFSKLEIFNTSSTGNNDVFKFYNGKTVDESQLITTLLKEAEIVKSTAADGSLTVSLKSITGVAANGWGAIVSEFEPGNMTYDATVVSAAATQTLSGENLNEAFLTFTIKTTNTENALTLQSLEIDASLSDYLSGIDKAKVYFLGKKNTFSTENLFGESSSSNAGIFTVSGIQALIEGNNYFAVVYDISKEVSNGDSIAASLTSITL